jgi:glycosyltransferase involved in cell wall biosynthesis
MPGERSITFAVATYGTEEILKNNFLASPCLRGSHGHQILIQKGFPSAAKAYNEAIDRTDNDLMVFAHHDLIFPETWLEQLERALAYLEETDPDWGVLGCCGVARDGVVHVWVYAANQGLLGRPFDRPEPIQTLDEIVLIFRRSSDLRFDECLPHFHLYGTDICLRAAKMGMKSYAIPAFCIHNATYYPVLPKEFYENYRYIRRTWKDCLPIYTSCQAITRMELPMYKRRMQEAYFQHIHRHALTLPRVKDVAELLRQANSAGQGV